MNMGAPESITEQVRTEIATDVAVRKAELLIAEREQDLREELADLISDARHGTPTDPYATRSAFPATLKCGCVVKLKDYGDGERGNYQDWWLCDDDEALGVKL
jgi:hypothetical protein